MSPTQELANRLAESHPVAYEAGRASIGVAMSIITGDSIITFLTGLLIVLQVLWLLQRWKWKREDRKRGVKDRDDE